MHADTMSPNRTDFSVVLPDMLYFFLILSSFSFCHVT
jgi:hypothetical protein